MKKFLSIIFFALIIILYIYGCTNRAEIPTPETYDNSNYSVTYEYGEKTPEINCDDFTQDNAFAVKKPIIYLYPEKITNVKVKLNFNGRLTDTYPTYNGEWNVTAYPDGTLINTGDKREYSYLFWEGLSSVKYDMSKGFVVKGCDVKDFLQEKLEYIGLTPKEYNEFIVYYLPIMQHNKYNLISFQADDYINNAKLDISPKPDSILRVFMTFKALDEPVDVKPQNLSKFTRRGFSVIEWGGADLTDA